MSSFNFNKKVILVTGGSKGIGRSICKDFALKGAIVLFTYRHKDKCVLTLENFKPQKNRTIFGFKMKNVSSEKEFQKLIKLLKKKFKRINYLINNVGDAIKRTKFVNSNANLWTQSFNSNLMNAVNITRSVLQNISHDDLEVIVNIGSISAKTGGQGDSLHYSSLKSALHTFSIGLSKELSGIRVMCIAPNAINTDFQKRLSSKTRIKKIIKNNLSNRLGTSDEISKTVMFLCSSDAKYINGEIFYITGGLK